MDVLRSTLSVCPVCLRRVPAQRVRLGKEVFLRKACAEHGPFQTVVWRGFGDMEAWVGDAEEGAPGTPPCPEGCGRGPEGRGLCPDHLRGTCCVLVEVTQRCNLACRFCFAGKGTEPGGSADPTLEELGAAFRHLADPGGTLVQLSGGEPTVREDLPRVIRAAREAGCTHVQLNTNGLRLGEEPGYAQALADAGLSFVFLQFDGTRDRVHEQLRGRPLLDLKTRAIDHCAAANLGVTLVPTLVPGVNTDQVGAILDFALARSPAVRGVHFQPVSYFGRAPSLPGDGQRFTLDELLEAIEAQTGGGIRREHLLPSRCDHPLCGFHGDFLVDGQGRAVPLSRTRKAQARTHGCCGPSLAEGNRAFVTRRWKRPPPGDPPGPPGDLGDMAVFLDRVKSHGFTVTAMAFQDAGNLDAERLRRCSLHVFHQGRLVPFCARYLSGWGS